MGNRGDAHVKMLLKGNDDHGYLYVGNSDGLNRRAQKAIASHKGRTRSCDHSVICGRSRRDRDDMVKEACKGVGVKRWVTCEHWHDEQHS